MKSDIQLQRDILDELGWEPSIDAAEIGVTVDDGVVRLDGRAPSYIEKLAAERAALRVAGVKAVANDIQVKSRGAAGPVDAEIARAAADALEWSVSVPAGRIKVAVSEGWVTLDGEVGWQWQRLAAQDAVRHLVGVRGVVNNILVKPQSSAAEVASQIEAAFRRSAEIDAKKVRIELEGDTITLRGDVRSWAERQEAERTAWAAPGVSHVENRIAVVPYATAYAADS